MKKRQVSASGGLALPLSLALFLLPGAVASAHETTLSRPDPADGSTVVVAPAHVTTRFSEGIDTTRGTIWMLQALAGVTVVLGLSEALRRRCR